MEFRKVERTQMSDIEKVAFMLHEATRDSSNRQAEYAAAYVLLRAKQDPSISMESIDRYFETSNESVDRELFLNNSLRDVWPRIRELQIQFSTEELKNFILFYEAAGTKSGPEEPQTPKGIIMLAKELLEIRPGDRVADFCTGRGGFIRDCFLDEPNAVYYGNDLNATVKETAAIRADILGGKITIEQGNILDLDENQKFDVAFANYPFGLRVRDQLRMANSNADYVWKKPEFTKAVYMDWAFNAAVFNSISGSRRAVCIMSNGSTWNTLDRPARKWFVENGFVEAVIALPERIFEHTSIGTTMIVLSRNHADVMMVDARELCEKGRRSNSITKPFVEEIIQCCKEETAHSKRVSCEELAANDYGLNPDRYMYEKVTIKNGVPFDSIIKNITRGAQITANDLDRMVSNVPTDIQYLMLSNIQDGIIDDELPYLSSLDRKQEKYCLRNNNLILSKNGTPFKVAVAEVPEGEKILANGNLYIIELDTEKVDPYYIKAFLESDKGVASLSSIVVGAVIPNIGIEQLKKIMVPCPPIEEQHAIVEKYRIAVDEVKLLRRRLNKAVSSLKHVFDEGEE